jgi:hypothetical protein
MGVDGSPHDSLVHDYGTARRSPWSLKVGRWLEGFVGRLELVATLGAVSQRVAHHLEVLEQAGGMHGKARLAPLGGEFVLHRGLRLVLGGLEPLHRLVVPKELERYARRLDVVVGLRSSAIFFQKRAGPADTGPAIERNARTHVRQRLSFKDARWTHAGSQGGHRGDTRWSRLQPTPTPSPMAEAPGLRLTEMPHLRSSDSISPISTLSGSSPEVACASRAWRTESSQVKSS